MVLNGGFISRHHPNSIELYFDLEDFEIKMIVQYKESEEYDPQIFDCYIFNVATFDNATKLFSALNRVASDASAIVQKRDNYECEVKLYIHETDEYKVKDVIIKNDDAYASFCLDDIKFVSSQEYDEYLIPDWIQMSYPRNDVIVMWIE